MSDITLIDMTAFLERKDRELRRMLIALLSLSVIVSAIVFAYGVRENGTAAAALAFLWLPTVLFPLTLVALWAAIALWGSKRPTARGGRHVMNADDAQNVARVANAGAVFVGCLGTLLIVSQAGLALARFEALPWPDDGGLRRGSIAVVGVLTAWFGNAWSRMPVPRAPEREASLQISFRRLFAWLMVVHGGLLAVAGLFLPHGALAAGVGAICAAMVLSLLASVIAFRSALHPARAK